MNARTSGEVKERVCGRCGVRHLPNERTPGKDYCLDCRPEALKFGWFIQPERKKTSC